jgi:uncharacterized protein YecT (DUF1311 family)
MRRLKTPAFLILLAGLVHISPVLAQDQKNPIDKQLDSCLNNPAASSTVAQTQCIASAGAAWDHELNETYQKLLKSLDPASQTSLRASQRQWLAFRDAERQFQVGPWSADQGSLAAVSLGLVNVDILRNRVLTLREYLGSAKR